MQNIIYSNKIDFLNKLENIKNGGLENLHFLADFDRTLTKAFSKGKIRASLISLLRSEGYLGKEYQEEAYRLFNHYNPIEINPNISKEEKIIEMTKWWNKHLNLLVKSGLNKKDIKSIIGTQIIELREGVKDFLEFLNKNNIPIIIISANGLGTDSINLFFEKENLLFYNIYVISNSFFWDKSGNSIGYDKRVVHTFNKGEVVLNEFPKIKGKIKNRKNVILLGDSLGDHHMIDGFEYENLIKIGFLNDNEDELLEAYKERYDIIITGDGNFDFINNLLEEIK